MNECCGSTSLPWTRCTLSEVYGSETLRQFTRIIHSRHAVVLGVTLEVDGSGVEVGRWSKVVVTRYCSESQSVYAQCIRGVHHTRVYNAVLVGVLLTSRDLVF